MTGELLVAQRFDPIEARRLERRQEPASRSDETNHILLHSISSGIRLPNEVRLTCSGR